MSDFRSILLKTLSEYAISLDDTAVDRLCIYNEMLVERNEVMNLTALTEPRDVALKHFADSLTLLTHCNIPEDSSVIDVGTGAGFPGMVLAIARPDLDITLLDSLLKRLGFLDEVGESMGIDNIHTVHSRAEDGAHTELRESFDIAVARAVAPLNVLCEYCLPYVRVGGRFIAMKGRDADAELEEAQNAIGLLGGRMTDRHGFTLGEAGERDIVEISKIAPTPEKYPRKAKQIKYKAL